MLIQTRWHEDDLAGSLLPADYDGRSGPVLCRDGDCFIEECVAFPAGRHDDEVDCLSLMGRVIDRLSRPVVGHLPEFADGGRVFEG